VKFNHFKHEVPFTASPQDVEQHGRALYQRLISGEFGAIHPHGTFSYTSEPRRNPRQINLSSVTMSLFGGAISEFEHENLRGTSRGVILVSAAITEMALAEIISKKRPGDELKKTLGGKIFQLKKIERLDSELLADLEAIRDIRNEAAHSLHFSAFESILAEKKAFEAYEYLYTGYAEALYHEVRDLLHVARFVVAPACLCSVERILQLQN
jgi:hypothetical protein